MYLIELTKYIFINLWSRKLRSLLAMFGILWGTASVILLVSLGHGFYLSNQKQLDMLSSGTFFAFPYQTSLSYQGTPQGTKINLRPNDLVNLAHRLSDIKSISFAVWNMAVPTHYGHYFSPNTVAGIDQDYLQNLKLILVPNSREFNKNDMLQSNKVIIIGDELKEKIFGRDNAIGKILFVSGIPFHIIGVLSPATAAFVKGVSNFSARNIFMPYTTYEAIWGKGNVSMIVGQAKPNVDYDKAVNQFLYYVAHKFHYDPADKTAITMADLKKALMFMSWFFNAIELFLGFCGVMTLAVGAISVANIMFLIVTEKTKEIGLRRALGAQDLDIMLQILLETFIIVFIGATLGLILAFIIIFTLQQLPLPTWLGSPTISTSSVFTTIVILGVVAFLAGYPPARRAVKLKPVEALSF